MTARTDAGFSLIEVLVALAVLAVVAGAGWQAFATGAAATTQADRRARAVTMAETLLAGALAQQPLSVGERSGHEQGFGWVLSVRPQRDPDTAWLPSRGLALYAVTATVRWDGGRELTLSTLRLEGVR
ncbi:prepilin-type N-terminal cleavage/methylation domain-containing protein [Azospirillum sp.]|uniref:prepilin-type N-terminal cleavage/methylation domain-containing protein n=1 Tax=Azospirillum sp. TaxID=34012 RepID=UPI002D224C2A|nr:prepilin-type N-terminal cleavage/methylation domain-containing protein [Azospirillum sp.]HYD69053.1 prepilin-type N-terminal cleavage/methylation domain-containing protein [Azospirillum sp.]